MDAQPAQQPISSTSARPQQPADAYAATLPVETLTRIFELALQHFIWPNEEKGQARRVKYGLVCRSWCSAALPLPHYIVSSSIKAERLTTLLRTTDRSRQAVRSVDIIAEEDKVSGRGARIAKLLSMCPNLVRVTIQIDRDLCSPSRRLQDGSLGKVVQDALASLHLATFELYGGDEVPAPVLQRFLKEWPRLQKLALWNTCSYTRDPIVFPSSTSLRSLSLSAVRDFKLTKALIAATTGTLEVLDVGEVYPTKGEELMTIIKPALSQLVSFTIADAEKPTWGATAQQPRAQGVYLESAFKEMSKIRHLIIGLDGFDLANLFPLLTELKTLRHFALRNWRDSPKDRLHDFEHHAPALLSFLNASGSSLRAISLPAYIDLDLTSYCLVERAIERQDIDLIWTF